MLSSPFASPFLPWLGAQISRLLFFRGELAPDKSTEPRRGDCPRSSFYFSKLNRISTRLQAFIFIFLIFPAWPLGFSKFLSGRQMAKGDPKITSNGANGGI